MNGAFYNFRDEGARKNEHVIGSFFIRDLTNADDTEVQAGIKPLRLRFEGLFTPEEREYILANSLPEPTPTAQPK